MDRYIAIDNVCAWPNLTLLRDGPPAGGYPAQPRGVARASRMGLPLIRRRTDMGCGQIVPGRARAWNVRGYPLWRYPARNRRRAVRFVLRRRDVIAQRTKIMAPKALHEECIAFHITPCY